MPLPIHARELMPWDVSQFTPRMNLGRTKHYILPASLPFPSTTISSATCYWHHIRPLLYYIMSVCCIFTAARGLVQRVVLVMCQRGRIQPSGGATNPKTNEYEHIRGVDGNMAWWVEGDDGCYRGGNRHSLQR